MPSPAGAGGSGGGGSSSSIFIPPGQAGVASELGNIVGPLAGLSQNAGAGTPGGWAYPTAQNLYNTFFDPGQQYSQYALQGADNASYYANSQLGAMQGYPQQIAQQAAGGLPYLSSLLSNAFNPQYGDLVNQATNNPYAGQAMAGATGAANMGWNGANAMQTAGQGLLNTAFDPQNALFQQQQGQLMNQANVANSMAGLGASPYGASTTANALGNFDINWQNQQLGRQESGAGAASSLLQAAPGLAAGSAALPYNMQNTQLANILPFLNAQNTAGIAGAGGFGSLLGSTGQGIAGAQGLASNIEQGLYGSSFLPYQAGSTIGTGGYNALNSSVNLGNNQFMLPQQVISDMEQYLGLGQSASQISGQLGQQGFNETAQALGGLGSLAGGVNSLFGGGSGAGSAAGGIGSGLFGAGSLLGSQGPLFGTAADLSIASGGPPLAAAAPLAWSP